MFFDWDKYNITPEGMQIIQLAANQYQGGRLGAAPGHRLHRHLGIGRATTSGSPSGAPMPSPPLSNASACRAAIWRSAAAAKTISVCRRRTAYASRRTGASRSSSPKALSPAFPSGGPRGPPATAANLRRFFFGASNARDAACLASAVRPMSDRQSHAGTKKQPCTNDQSRSA